MKASAAFALGLWTGAAVVAVVGAFHLRVWQPGPSHNAINAADALQAKNEQIVSLEQDKARLAAEEARLRQTVADLKNDLAARERVEGPRPVRPERSHPPPPAVTPETWIEDAVAQVDLEAVPQLEQAAVKGDASALEALALLADRDSGEGLARVWASESASLTTKTRAIRYIAATFEVNPHAEEMLRSVLTTPDVDPVIMRAAIDGLSNPNFGNRLAINTHTAPPPHFRPDYATRLRWLDLARSTAAEDRLRETIEQSRESVLAQWTAADPATAPTPTQ